MWSDFVLWYPKSSWTNTGSVPVAGMGKPKLLLRHAQGLRRA